MIIKISHNRLLTFLCYFSIIITITACSNLSKNKDLVCADKNEKEVTRISDLPFLVQIKLLNTMAEAYEKDQDIIKAVIMYKYIAKYYPESKESSLAKGKITSYMEELSISQQDEDFVERKIISLRIKERICKEKTYGTHIFTK